MNLPCSRSSCLFSTIISVLRKHGQSQYQGNAFVWLAPFYGNNDTSIDTEAEARTREFLTSMARHSQTSWHASTPRKRVFMGTHYASVVSIDIMVRKQMLLWSRFQAVECLLVQRASVVRTEASVDRSRKSTFSLIFDGVWIAFEPGAFFAVLQAVEILPYNVQFLSHLGKSNLIWLSLQVRPQRSCFWILGDFIDREEVWMPLPSPSRIRCTHLRRLWRHIFCIASLQLLCPWGADDGRVFATWRFVVHIELLWW